MSLIRTQIQLEEKQYQALKKKALEEKVSVSELLRRAADRLLCEGHPEITPWRRQKILELLGKYRSGTPGISEKHDQYLEEAFR